MSVSRRGFLAGLATGAGVLTAGSAKAAGVKHFEGHKGRFGLLHDTTLCVGCRSCEAACKQVNGHPPLDKPIDDKSVFEQHRRITPTQFTVVNRYREGEGRTPPVYRKHQCMHCNEPCCASVCLVHAFEKTPEGPVLYDPDVCLGCRYCVMACPYNALSYEYDSAFDPKVMRCTMCYPRIKEGKNPGCADACPTGAILYGEREELIEIAQERIRKDPDRYIDHIFGEHEFGGTSWMVLSGTGFGNLGLHEGVTHESLPSIGTSYLSVVPLVVTIYPGLLMAFYAFSKRKDKLAHEELEEAVRAAVEKADEETKAKLKQATDKAARTRKRPSTPQSKRPSKKPRRKPLKAKWTSRAGGKVMSDAVHSPRGKLLSPFNVIAGIILLVGGGIILLRFAQGLEATTNLTHYYPWGVWIGFDVMSGVALAAGGFVTSSAVYLFGMKEYKPIVRPAILTGFLGYFLVVLGLLVDLGKPWHLPYPFIVQAGPTSALFEVSLCVACT